MRKISSEEISVRKIYSAENLRVKYQCGKVSEEKFARINSSEDEFILF